MCIVHVSLVPIIGVVGEQKTKPTQHSVAVLRSLGLHPDLLACRCSEPLDDSVRQKLVRVLWLAVWGTCVLWAAAAVGGEVCCGWDSGGVGLGGTSVVARNGGGMNAVGRAE
jgi:hypothetical protein